MSSRRSDGQPGNNAHLFLEGVDWKVGGGPGLDRLQEL